MKNDLEFRIAYLALGLAVRIVRSRKRQLVGWRANWAAMKEHPLDGVLLIFCVFCWNAAFAGYVLLGHHLSATSLPIPTALRWLGVGIGACGVALVGWADHCLGQNLSVTMQIKENHTLVTTGPYRWIRHPIYLSGMILSAAAWLYTANWLIAGLMSLGIAPLYFTRLRQEEAMMLDAFGDQYRQYMSRTGRLIVRLRRDRGAG